MSYPMMYPPMERRPDGSLVRMTPKHHREAVRIINERCCNCDDGNCLLLDDGEAIVCDRLPPYLIVLCLLYNLSECIAEGAGGKKLEADIFHIDAVRRCASCGKPFASTGKRTKYYAECKGTVQREQKAEYARRRRAESRKIEEQKMRNINALFASNPASRCTLYSDIQTSDQTIYAYQI